VISTTRALFYYFAILKPTSLPVSHCCMSVQVFQAVGNCDLDVLDKLRSDDDRFVHRTYDWGWTLAHFAAATGMFEVLYIYVCVWIRKYIHICVCVCVCVCVNIYIYMYMYVCMYTCIFIYVYIYMYTYILCTLPLDWGWTLAHFTAATGHV